MVFNWNNIEFVDIAVNAGDLTGGYYHEILMRIRHRMADDCIRCSTGTSRPILPEYNSSNTRIRWFQINLRLNPTTRLTLLLRRDDLYVVGYRVNDQRWREFGEEGRNTHLINGSEFLGFSGSYTDLTRIATQGSVGRDALVTATRSLVTSSHRETVARSLLVMITMFSEAARFLPIQQFVSDSFFDSSPVPDWIGDLVVRWGRLCGYVLYYNGHPEEQWVPQTLVLGDQTVVVRTIDDMLNYLGILMNNPDKIRPAPPNS